MRTTSQQQLTPLISVSIREEVDIVTARQRARQLASELGFGSQDQVRIATAVSEIARNAFQYAGAGRVEFAVDLNSTPQLLSVVVSDEGRGIADVQAVLDGRYRSSTGMGIGLSGTRRLMDEFQLDSEPGAGTKVRFAKYLLPGRRVQMPEVSTLTSRLAQQRPGSAFEEVRQQNAELLRVLEDVRARETELDRRQSELGRLNLELEETNRGVVALYAELDEKATALRRADELKSRFLSHVSHEFRTPLNSILALANLLITRADGDLTSEQERQVGYIKRSAQDLVEMVNDLLDLSRVEAGKTEIRRTRFELSQLFGVVRGIMRPLATNDAVTLVVEDAPPGLAIESDEAKVAQILRNLISNALKFTEHGHVRVYGRISASCDQVQICVTDTGIGISASDRDRIFQEFAQVDNPLQRRVKGTGLGLPLSRKLANLLGGDLAVVSSPGEGSTFTLTLPLDAGSSADALDKMEMAHSDAILIIDDEETARYITRQLFRGTRRPVLEASGGFEGAERARFERPALIVLDVVMPDRSGFDVLDDLKADPATRDIPVVIQTSRKLNSQEQVRLGGRQLGVLSKGGADESVLDRIRTILNEPQLFGGRPPGE